MQENKQRVEILGCPVDNLTLGETVAQINKLVMLRRPAQHVVINVDKMIKLRKDPSLKTIISACDIINADGMPIVWVSRLFGSPLKERVAGIDLMERLLSEGNQSKFLFYFLGAREEVVRKAVEICRNKYSGVNIAGFRNGYWTDDEEKEVVEGIKRSCSDILFVGMSSPKKEIFLNKYLAEMGIPFVMGVGGSFDILSGIKTRAPLWMQRLGLEWLWRFIQEPGRLWKRYVINNSLFTLIVLKELLIQYKLIKPSLDNARRN